MVTSCDYSEDALQPSGVLTSYQLPQGDHDYDQTILDFNKKYGVCMLYEFNNKDAYWSPTGWNNYKFNETTPTSTIAGYLVEKADQAYVGQQINLLKDVWFDKLPEKAKKDLLPMKILLCNTVDSCYTKTEWTFDWSVTPVKMESKVTEQKKSIPCWYNFDHICFGFGNANIASLTETDKRNISYRIMHTWIEYAGEHLIKPTEEFANSVNYSSLESKYYVKDNCAQGILSASYNATAKNDWARFMVMMLCYPESWLNDATATVGNYDSWSSPSSFTEPNNFKGILTSVKDVNGIILKRYNMVRQYYIDNYGFDLQSVGNTF